MSDSEEASADPSYPTKTIRTRRNVNKKDDLSETPEKTGHLKWTVKEYKILQDGLQKFGLTRLETIADLLPNRTLEQVKGCLWKAGREVHRLKAKERELGSMYNKPGGETAVGVSMGISGRYMKATAQTKQLSAITRSLLLIENLEEHPPCSGRPNEIDFQTLYNSLYMVMKGYPLPDMNEATLKFFCESFDSLLRAATSDPIESFPLGDNKALEALAGHLAFNPLSLPVDNLKARIDITGTTYDEYQKPMMDWLSKSDWNSI